MKSSNTNVMQALLGAPCKRLLLDDRRAETVRVGWRMPRASLRTKSFHEDAACFEGAYCEKLPFDDMIGLYDHAAVEDERV